MLGNKEYDFTPIKEKALLKRLSKLENNIPKGLTNALDKVFPEKWCVSTEAVVKEFKEYGLFSESENLSYFYRNRLYKAKYVDIIISLGDFEIKNNIRSHILTDFYIKLRIVFDDGKLDTISLHGGRSSLSELEAKRNYIHSHLSICSAGEFGPFCLGSNPLVSLLNYPPGEDADPGEWELMLHSIRESIKWESKSGVPYKYLDSLYGRELGIVHYTNYYIKSFLKLYEKTSFSSAKYKVDNSSITMISSQALEDELYDLVTSDETRNKWHSHSSLLRFKTSDNRYLSESDKNNNDRIKDKDDEYLFTFRGEKIYSKLILENDTKQDEEFKYNSVCPYFTKGVAKYLSKRITEEHITNSGIKSEDRVEDTLEGVESDKILVQ